MHRPGRWLLWLLIAIAAASGGYIWWDHLRSDAEEELENSLSQFQEPIVKPVTPAAGEGRTLRLNLSRGDVFPLVKTVEEVVTQQTDEGPLHSRTKIQLVLAIRVQAVEGDRKRLRVDYRRVKYERDLAGETLRYDSADPPRVLPLEVLAYHGMVNNGFEFWLGPENQIVKLDEFEDFLKRCVAHVSGAQRREVLTRFLKTTGDDGVANFIDDSIGLLPYREKPVQVGDVWTRKRQILRPVPLYLIQQCTLKRLDEQFADIEISGRIAPAATYGPSDQPQNGLQLIIRGGHSVGTCRIRRQTGLPQRSEIRRIYDMLVRYPDGRQFQQTKDSRTIIEVFSPQGEPQTIGSARASKLSTLPSPPQQRRSGNVRPASLRRAAP